MEYDNDNMRVGICRYTQRRILQVVDPDSDDAPDEEGWLCLHQDSDEEEHQQLLDFLYGIDLMVCSN